MKKLRNLIVLALASIILLSACTTGTPDGSSDTGNASTSNEDSGEDEEKEEETELEKNLKMLIGSTNFDANADNVVNVLEEWTGFRIEFDNLPSENAADKLNLIFSGGKVDYDIVRVGNSSVDKSLYVTFAKNGLLKDLTDEVANYEELMKIDEIAYDSVTVEGQLYGIPSTGLPYASGTSYIRQDWLDVIEKEVPTTPDEFYEVLKLFKEEDPMGLGENNIPYSTYPSVLTDGITSGFGFAYIYEDRDGELVDMRLTSEYKEYLTFLNKLYTEGLMDADFPINTHAQLLEKGVADRVGAYSNGGTNVTRDVMIAKNEEGIEGPFYVAMEPFKDSNGEQHSRSNEGLSAISFIPESSENTEAVLTYMNKYLSDECFVNIIHGDEGVDYEVVDGERVPILPAFNENRGNLYALYPVQHGKIYFEPWKLRTRKSVEEGMAFQELFDTTDAFLELNPLGFAPSFDTVSGQIKLVDDYAQQEITKFIAGARSLDEFDAFVEEMNTKGAQEILTEYNNWYVNN